MFTIQAKDVDRTNYENASTNGSLKIAAAGQGYIKIEDPSEFGIQNLKIGPEGFDLTINIYMNLNTDPGTPEQMGLVYTDSVTSATATIYNKFMDSFESFKNKVVIDVTNDGLAEAVIYYWLSASPHGAMPMRRF